MPSADRVRAIAEAVVRPTGVPPVSPDANPAAKGRFPAPALTPAHNREPEPEPYVEPFWFDAAATARRALRRGR
jgi:hypothetical protein